LRQQTELAFFVVDELIPSEADGGEPSPPALERREVV
jgi:hypothetical protein